MQTIHTIQKLRLAVQKARAEGKSIGFVPTMGAFHQGHIALIQRCKKDHGLCVVSIFVNPTQFGPKEDYRNYPRDKRRDCRMAAEAGADVVFYPSVEEMYPVEYSSFIDVPDVTETLCGKSRPHHFRGVATVVAKLFLIVNPDQAYFGQKDYQQTVVIQKMARDLNFPVKIRVIPTVREPDGLAMSSRNIYLTPQERSEAAVLFASLQAAKKSVGKGEKDPEAIKTLIRSMIKRTSGRIDYIECADALTLRPVRHLKGRCVIALAVFFGKARLIDNIILQI